MDSRYIGIGLWHVLFCNWVKVITRGKNNNEVRLIWIHITSLPFLEDSFAFPIHVKQIFFLDDFCKLG